MKKLLLMMSIVLLSCSLHAQYMVAFSDSAEVNGIYTEDGVNKGKPKYANGTFSLYYKDCTVKWILSDNHGCPIYSALADSVKPPIEGWDIGGKSGLNFKSHNIAVASLNSLAFNKKYFVENAVDNGTYTDSINVLLYAENETFSGINGEDFVANGKILAANIPVGLILTAIRNSDSTLTVFLTGIENSHSVDDDIENLSLNFTGAAFISGSTDGIANTETTTVKVLHQKKYLVSGATSDTEVNGEYLLAGIKANKPYYVMDDYVIYYKGCTTKWALAAYYSNCPNYKTQVDGDDVSAERWNEISVYQQNAIYYSTNMVIEAAVDDGSVNDSINITYPLPVNDNKFSGINGDDFIADGKIVLPNLPEGLIAQAFRVSDTLITVKFSGNASEHEYVNSINNLTIELNNNVFADNNVSNVKNLIKNDINICFIRLIAVKYAITTPSVNGIYHSFGVVNGKMAFKNDSGYYLGYRNCSSTKWVIVKTNEGEGDAEGIKRITKELRTCPKYSSSLDSDDVPAKAWGQGGNGGQNGLDDLIEVHSLNSFVFNSNNLSESISNDGSIADTIALTYYFPANNNKFVGNNGDDFIALRHLTVTNLPQGLTAIAARYNDTTLVLRFGGAAINHKFSDNIQNLQIELANTALLNGNANQITGYSSSVNLVFQKQLEVSESSNGVNGIYVTKGYVNGKPYFSDGTNLIGYRGRGYKWVILNTAEETFLESYLNPKERTETDGDIPPVDSWNNDRLQVDRYNCIKYSKTIFNESTSSKGCIDNSDTLIIEYYRPLSNSKFSGQNDDDFFADKKVTVENIPAGLVPVITRANDSTLKVVINGNSSATYINNLTFSFNQSAFENGSISEIDFTAKNDFIIDFNEEFYVASTGGDFATIAEAISSDLVGDGDVLNLAAETFTEEGIFISKTLTIIGQGANKTIVQAASTPKTASNRIFSVYAKGVSLSLKNMTLQNGYSNGDGGCIYYRDDSKIGELNIDNCILKNNETLVGYGMGGAIAFSKGKFTLTNSTIYNNQLGTNHREYRRGGGAISISESDSINIISNCTFSENNANDFSGGAIFVLNCVGKVNIINSTFNNNNSNTSGKAIISCSSDVFAKNCLFVNNDVRYSKAEYCLFDVNSGSITGTENISGVDAQVSALDWNGGTTPTCAIATDSPAKDAGNNAYAPEKDQRGVTIYNTTRDIGAYEFNSNPVLMTSATELNFGLSTSGESKEMNYSLSANNLTNDITLTAPTDCQLSVFSGTNFVGSSVLTITSEAGSVSDTVIYVQYSPVSTELNSNLTIESDGATTINILLKGEVNTAPTGSNESIALTEDIQKVFSDDDFTFTDANNDDVFAGIKIINTVAKGFLKYNGTEVLDGAICDIPELITYENFANENGNNYTTFTFKVKDNRGAYSADVYTATFDVTPINDAPVFNAIATNLNVDENSSVGKELLTLSANDVDDDELSFTTAETKVSINAATGKVTIADSAYFNAEVNTSLTFDVKVSDGDLEDTETVSIAINNMNDTPVFDAIAADLNINENSIVGTELLTLLATDEDENSLTYSTTETKVAVDATSGIVTIVDAAYFDAETNTNISFDVKVSDGTNEDTETVSIAINNLNDNAPAFAAIASGLTIDENSAVGTELLTLSASDADGTLNTLAYSTTDTKVAVDETSGIVTIVDATYFDAETNANISFDVKVSDGINEDTETVTLTTNNLNDNAPAFAAIASDLTIDENSVTGTELLTLSATDADGSLNTLNFSTTETKVTVNETTGVVTILDAAYFDAETNASISFNVKVSDGTNEDTETVNIAINNTNDNNPVFETIASDLSVDENSAAGTELLTISANDADGNLNALSFSTTETKVAVDETTGKVTIVDAAYFDAETNTNISFDVKVSDGINEDTERVKIVINNLNDNNPVFDETSYAFEIKDNIDLGTIVGTISGTDIDNLGTLSYSIPVSVTAFAIDVSTGVITVADQTALKQLSGTTENISVSVSDGENTTNVTCAITITKTTGIFDINVENAFKVYPNPNNGIFTIEINESLQEGIISILNMSGVLVYQTQCNSMNKTIDISNFGKGIFFVKIESEGKIQAKKIIIR